MHKVVWIECGDQKPTWKEQEADTESGRTQPLDNAKNLHEPSYLYDRALATACRDDTKVLVYIHSDLEILGPSIDRVMALMAKPNVVAVGLGGALGLGNRDLYRKPYQIFNMARNDYRSNQVDAETHGKRFTGECRVAVLDAFFMAVSVEWLASVGGWPTQLTHHCLDTWIACQAARDGKEIWMAGVLCNHKGGGTSTKEAYEKAPWLQGGTTRSDHELPHRWLWDTYRDVLPIEVRG